jgi:hypothetical protein
MVVERQGQPQLPQLHLLSDVCAETDRAIHEDG